MTIAKCQMSVSPLVTSAKRELLLGRSERVSKNVPNLAIGRFQRSDLRV